MIPQEIYKAAFDKWGYEAQVDVLIEECAELIKAAMKVRRAAPGEVMTRANEFYEELADVEIMIEQMRAINGDKYIDMHKTEKLRRLEILVRNK